MENEHKIKIVAKTKQEFEEITTLLEMLHPSVYVQIEKAEKGAVGLECYIGYEFVESIKLPSGVTQITDFEKYIGIYCDKYFFKIEGNFKKCKISYVLGYENSKPKI